MGTELDFGDQRLGALALRLAQTTDLQELLTLVSDEVAHALETPDCVIYLVDSDAKDTLVQSAAWGVKNPNNSTAIEEGALSLAFGQGVVGTAAATATSQLVLDTRTDSRHVSDTGSGRSELAVPIVVRSAVVGVIDSEHPEVAHYNRRHQQALEQIAALVGAQIQAAMALGSLQASLLAQAELTRELRDAVMVDALCSIANRRAFDLELASWVEEGNLFWACVIDLDGFKDINDAHGHAAGDEALKTVARLLEELVGHESSTFVARTGGDEFAILTRMPNTMLQSHLKLALDRISESSAQLGRSSASIGIACGADKETLRRADDAMLIAKRKGGGQIIDYAVVPDEVAALKLRRSWRERVGELTSGNDLHLVYQPIVDLHNLDAAPIAYEALLRIADGSSTTTAELVEAVTRYHHDQELDLRVLDDTLDVLQLHPDIVVSQNWSPRSFDVAGSVMPTLFAELERRNINPANVIVEVTEHARIENPEQFRQAVNELRSRGINVALDDLGAGWSSFSFLVETPVDIIKLDGEWVRQVNTSEIARELVETTVRCAELTGARVVAEWVETEAQLEALQELGVHWGQGYLLGRPAPLGRQFLPNNERQSF